VSDKAYTVIGTNVVIDCGTVEEAIAYERELWANQPYAPPVYTLAATPAPLPCLKPDFGGDDCRFWSATYGQAPCANCAKRYALAATPAPPDVLFLNDEVPESLISLADKWLDLTTEALDGVALDLICKNVRGFAVWADLKRRARAYDAPMTSDGPASHTVDGEPSGPPPLPPANESLMGEPS